MPKTYCETINETLHDIMERDPAVVIIGACCVKSPWYVGGTLKGLPEKYPDRVIDGPLSEHGITSAAIGMALNGLKPFVIFPRRDFMFYALDAIVNQAAKWRFMFGGAAGVPIVFWAIRNGGGSQGAQHNQDLQDMLYGFAGLRFASCDCSCMIRKTFEKMVNSPDPVVFFDDRDRYHEACNHDPPLDARLWKTTGREPIFPASEPLEAVAIKNRTVNMKMWPV